MAATHPRSPGATGLRSGLRRLVAGACWIGIACISGGCPENPNMMSRPSDVAVGLQLLPSIIDVRQGETATARIVVSRGEGITRQDLELEIVGQAPDVDMMVSGQRLLVDPLRIPGPSNEAQLVVRPAASAATGTAFFRLRARAFQPSDPHDWTEVQGTVNVSPSDANLRFRCFPGELVVRPGQPSASVVCSFEPRPPTGAEGDFTIGPAPGYLQPQPAQGSIGASGSFAFIVSLVPDAQPPAFVDLPITARIVGLTRQATVRVHMPAIAGITVIHQQGS